MDTSLDQFIKDRKIKFPGRGGRGVGVRQFSGNNRGRSNFNRGFNRGGLGFNQSFNQSFNRSFNRGGRGSFFQQRRGTNFNNQRGFQRNMGMGFNQRGRGFMVQNRNFNSGFGRGQMNFRGRSFFNNRGQQNSFGVIRGGIMKRQPFSTPTGGLGMRNVPTKLYISNLDFGVSNEDIKELFSEFGRFRRYGVNFAQGGQSLGTAEVQFENRVSAIKAVQKYNNVPLDGRPMKLAISGPDANSTVVSSAPTAQSRIMTPRNNMPMRYMPMRNSGPMNAQRAMGQGVTKRLVQRSKMTLMRGGYRNSAMGGNTRGGFVMRGGNRGGRGRGTGFQRGARGFARGGKNKPEPTQQQLDADLDAFNAKTD